MTPEMTDAELSKQLALLLGYQIVVEGDHPSNLRCWIECDGFRVSDISSNPEVAWETMQPQFAEDAGAILDVVVNRGLGVDVSVLQPDALVVVTLFRDAVPILKRTGEDAARVLCEALIEALKGEQS